MDKPHFTAWPLQGGAPLAAAAAAAAALLVVCTVLTLCIVCTPCYSLHRRSAAGCRLLVQGGADVNAMDRFLHATPLHMACMQGSSACVQQLIEVGAKVEAVNIDTDTALHIAARRGYADTCDMLLKNGANVDAACARGGWTPLIHAAKGRWPKVVAVLLKHNATVDQPLHVSASPSQQVLHSPSHSLGTVCCVVSQSQWTALHMAARYHDRRIISLLLDAGADRTLETSEGETYEEVMDAFDEKGRRIASKSKSSESKK